MDVQDKQRFGECIGGLAVAFQREATQPLLRAYWLGLDDLSITVVERAAKQALRSCRFMPTVAELRELTGGMSADARAEQAWIVFEQAVVHHGAYRSVDFDDSILNATVRSLGGWTRVCDLPRDEFDKWLRKDFIKTYSTFAKSPPSIEAMEPLTGITDATNGTNGHEIRPPVKILTGLPPIIDRPAITQASNRALAASVAEKLTIGQEDRKP